MRSASFSLEDGAKIIFGYCVRQSVLAWAQSGDTRAARNRAAVEILITTLRTLFI